MFQVYAGAPDATTMNEKLSESDAYSRPMLVPLGPPVRLPGLMVEDGDDSTMADDGDDSTEGDVSARAANNGKRVEPQLFMQDFLCVYTVEDGENDTPADESVGNDGDGDDPVHYKLIKALVEADDTGIVSLEVEYFDSYPLPLPPSSMESSKPNTQPFSLFSKVTAISSIQLRATTSSGRNMPQYTAGAGAEAADQDALAWEEVFVLVADEVGSFCLYHDTSSEQRGASAEFQYADNWAPNDLGAVDLLEITTCGSLQLLSTSTSTENMHSATSDAAPRLLDAMLIECEDSSGEANVLQFCALVLWHDAVAHSVVADRYIIACVDGEDCTARFLRNDEEEEIPSAWLHKRYHSLRLNAPPLAISDTPESKEYGVLVSGRVRVMPADVDKSATADGHNDAQVQQYMLFCSTGSGHIFAAESKVHLDMMATTPEDAVIQHVNWKQVGVGKNLGVGTAAGSMMLVSDYGYCYNSHDHNTRSSPMVCSSEPEPTRYVLDYSLGTAADWLDALTFKADKKFSELSASYSNGTVPSFSEAQAAAITPCHSTVLHGSYDQGSFPSVAMASVTVQGINSGPDNSNRGSDCVGGEGEGTVSWVYFLEVHEALDKQSLPGGGCGNPLHRDGIVLDSFPIDAWIGAT